MSGGVAGESRGGLVAVLWDLGVVLECLGGSWCGLEASWCGLGASWRGLGAVLAPLGGLKMARDRFGDLRRSASQCKRVRAAMGEALGDPISNDYFILLND